MQIQLHPLRSVQPSLYAEWQSLANSPLEDPDWLISWWTVYSKSYKLWQLKLITMRHQQRLVGIAPFYVTHGRLRQLGTGLVCTDHQELAITRPTDRDATIGQLITWLWESPAADFWRVIELECIDRGNTTHRQLEHLQASGTSPVFMTSEVANCCVRLAPTWDDYLRTVSKNHRKRCRRLWKKYFDGGLVQSISTEDGWHPHEALDALIELHNKRRRDVGGESIFNDANFLRFQRIAFTSLANRGMARICGLQLDGVLVAAEYELVGAETLYSYQSGLDPAAKQHSPGTLSIMSSIRRAIREGKHRCDLMRGAEPYKAHWNATTCPTHRIKAWRSSVTGRLALSSNLLWHGSKELLRDFVK